MPRTLIRQPRLQRPHGWDAAVAASVLLLVLLALALGVGWLASGVTHTSRYAITNPVSNVDVELSSGSIDVVGGGTSSIDVQRVDRFAFGRSPREHRLYAGGLLSLSSSCPKIVVGSCSSSYRLKVPDDVSVNVRTTHGDVHLAGFRGNAQIATRSGDIAVDAFCGFALVATSHSGGVKVTSACAPKSLDLRSISGAVTALVPPGRYRVHATSGSSRPRVSGIVERADAPFSIDVDSRSGDVTVLGGL